MRRAFRTGSFLTILLALMASAVVRAGQVPADAIAKIDQALPDAPSVKPKGPRKILIFTLCKGFVHSSIPYGAEAFKRMGDQTGAWESVVSDDVSMFEHERLDDFDAIIFVSTTGTLFEDPQLKENLLDFVRGGKGIVGSHAATDCFYDWEEFGEMMGGYFLNHPWNEEVTIKIEDRDHPICAAFEGDQFVVADEIYQFRPEHYSRENLRVLLSLDTTGTDMTKPGIAREDGDFGVSWVRSYGEGRVFYCSLGHREAIFWNPTVLRHYLDGIQFALGDLKADTTPSAALQDDTGGGGAALDQLFNDVAQYEFGESRLPLSQAEAAIVASLDNDARRRGVEARLIALIETNDATVEAKEFACRQLAVAGTGEAAPALGRLLSDQRLSHMARYALERIPGDAAGQALTDALDDVEGDILIGVINSIGRRGDDFAVEALAAIAPEADFNTIRAIIIAAANIGGEAGAELLAAMPLPEEGSDDPAFADAYLRLVESIMEERDEELEALAAFDRVARSDEEHVAYAGLRNLSEHAPMHSIAKLLEWLRGDDERRRLDAARVIAETPHTGQTSALERYFSNSPPEARIAMLDAFARRGDPVALNTVARAATSDEERSVRLAAIEALAALGDGSTVETLIPLLTSDDAEIAGAAESTLRRMRGSDVDEAIAAALESDSSDLRIALAQSLAERNAIDQTWPLFKLFDAAREEQVRLAAVEAIGRLSPPRYLRNLVERLRDSSAAAVRRAILDSIELVAGRGDAESGASTMVAIMDGTEGDARAHLALALSRVGGQTALDAVRAAYDEDDAAVRDAAINALANWPDAGALNTLFDIASTTDNADHRRVAVEGYLAITERSSALPAQEKARRHARIAGELQSDDERARLLNALSSVAHPEAMELAESFLDRDSLRHDAALAIFSIAREMSNEHGTRARASINRALDAAGDDEELRQLAGAAINHLDRDEDFITGWEVAGPYATEGVGAGSLFDSVFPPDPGGGDDDDVEWRSMPEEAFTAPGVYDLTVFQPNSDACLYLRSIIECDARQPARLEIGSDDGVKVWLNGDVVHANNVMRGLSRGQDVVDVRLEPGENVLIMKVTQGGGGWAAACRIRGQYGFPLGWSQR